MAILFSNNVVHSSRHIVTPSLAIFLSKTRLRGVYYNRANRCKEYGVNFASASLDYLSKLRRDSVVTSEAQTKKSIVRI